ncbi:MAG: endopeptidase La [Deltaproteobacteria bacterium]|nr:MAG: endopeptidase La [Deltaproteobacteria bacterium]
MSDEIKEIPLLSASEQPDDNPPEDIEVLDDEQPGEPDIPTSLPLLPIRDIVVFNYMILPLFVGRERSIHAVDEALNRNRYVLICTQKEDNDEEPETDDLFTVGTVGMVMRMLKMPDGRLKVLVQGLARARVKEFVHHESYDEAVIELIEDPETPETGPEQEALLRTVKEQTEKILSLRGIDTSEIMAVLNSVNHHGRLADLVVSNLRVKPLDAQKILECEDPVKRLVLVNEQLTKEVEVTSMQAKIHSMAKEGMDKAQREYFLREQLKAIRKELGDMGENGEGDEFDDIRTALAKAGLPAKVKAEAEKQLSRLEGMHPDSSEATVIRIYLDWIVDIPWKKISRDQLDITKANAILEEDHYGLEKVKERILEYLSVRKLNPKMKGPILCFVGPPGVGKTSLGRSIARSLNRKFVRMSLGGMRDEAEIRGHRRTYIGAMPGRIIQGMKEAETRNPVFMLDEIDKVGQDFRGDPSSALLEVLDPEQNNSFTDHYLNVPYDLSKVMFICTANVLDTIPSALLDRMEVIRITGYTRQEKIKIARRYLLPRQIRENGIKAKDIQVSNAVIARVIQEYTREAGLRNLERELGGLCRKIARKIAEGKKGPFRITPKGLPKLLGLPKFVDEDRDKELPPGVAQGLAWTAYGGETLYIEASILPGKGKLLLTGQLGDVMKESAQAALSYARSKAEDLGLDTDFTEKKDIHIHVPAGSTPKDGPSAGVTLVTALISALTGKPIRSDIAMTGEITLRGRVMPVGGIKEKVLAAVGAGLKKVIIPFQNENDFKEIPQELRRKIEVKIVEHIDEIWPEVQREP